MLRQLIARQQTRHDARWQLQRQLCRCAAGAVDAGSTAGIKRRSGQHASRPGARAFGWLAGCTCFLMQRCATLTLATMTNTAYRIANVLQRFS